MLPVRGCSFSGYRPEKFSFSLTVGSAGRALLERALDREITAAADDGITDFYCGCAKGFDILAGEAVIRMKAIRPGIRLICVMPYESMVKDWEPEWRARLFDITSECDEKITLSSSYHRGVFHQRNKYLIEHSEMLIAFYDGKSGGTESTLALAEKKGIRTVNIAEGVNAEAISAPYRRYYIAEPPEAKQ